MLLCVAAGVMRSCRCVTGWCGIKAQLQLKAWDTAGKPHALGIQLLAYRVHGMFTSPPRFRSRMMRSSSRVLICENQPGAFPVESDISLSIAIDRALFRMPVTLRRQISNRYIMCMYWRESGPILGSSR